MPLQRRKHAPSQSVITKEYKEVLYEQRASVVWREVCASKVNAPGVGLCALHMCLLHRYRARCESGVKRMLPTPPQFTYDNAEACGCERVEPSKGSCAACSCPLLYEPGSGRLQCLLPALQYFVLCSFNASLAVISPPEVYARYSAGRVCNVPDANVCANTHLHQEAPRTELFLSP